MNNLKNVNNFLLKIFTKILALLAYLLIINTNNILDKCFKIKESYKIINYRTHKLSNKIY